MIEMGSSSVPSSSWQRSGSSELDAPVHVRHAPGAPGGAGRVKIAIESLGIAPRGAPRAEQCTRNEVADRGCRLRAGDGRRSRMQANDALKPSSARVVASG